MAYSIDPVETPSACSSAGSDDVFYENHPDPAADAATAQAPTTAQQGTPTDPFPVYVDPLPQTINERMLGVSEHQNFVTDDRAEERSDLNELKRDIWLKIRSLSSLVSLFYTDIVSNAVVIITHGQRNYEELTRCLRQQQVSGRCAVWQIPNRDLQEVTNCQSPYDKTAGIEWLTTTKHLYSAIGEAQPGSEPSEFEHRMISYGSRLYSTDTLPLTTDGSSNWWSRVKENQLKLFQHPQQPLDRPICVAYPVDYVKNLTTNGKTSIISAILYGQGPDGEGSYLLTTASSHILHYTPREYSGINTERLYYVQATSKLCFRANKDAENIVSIYTIPDHNSAYDVLVMKLRDWPFAVRNTTDLLSHHKIRKSGYAYSKDILKEEGWHQLDVYRYDKERGRIIVRPSTSESVTRGSFTFGVLTDLDAACLIGSTRIPCMLVRRVDGKPFADRDSYGSLVMAKDTLEQKRILVLGMVHKTYVLKIKASVDAKDMEKEVHYTVVIPWYETLKALEQRGVRLTFQCEDD